MLLANGQRIDRYVVEGKIGAGGVATVYRVRHLTLGTLHALKVLTLTAPDVRARLVQEGQVQAAMDHPNVLQVTDVLDVNGAPGLLMRFVEGTTLEHWLARYDPTHDEAMALFRGICAGVGYAHLRGFVHRDLKPGNVLLALTEGRLVPKVSDFGLARILQTGAMRSEIGATLGTPGTMAPEQSRDASAVDRRTDLWSLGCILYRLTVGVEPFPGDEVREILRAVEAGDFVPSRALRPELPDRVHAAIERLLTVDPGRRPHDAALLLSYVDGEVDSLPAAIPGAPLPRPTRLTTTRATALVGTEGVHVARELAEETLSRVATLAPHLRTPRHWLEAGIGPPPLQSSMTLSPAPEDRSEEARVFHVEHPAGERASQKGRWGDRRVVLGVAAFGAIVAGGLTLVAAVVVTAAFLTGGPGSRPVDVAVRPPAVALPTGEPPRGMEVLEEPPERERPRGTGAGGAVTFTGADHVWLEPVGGGEPVRDLRAVPRGRYRILAVFPDTPEVVPAGEIVVPGSGREVAITCEPDLMRCRAGR